jgi:hypothetical protein
LQGNIKPDRINQLLKKQAMKISANIIGAAIVLVLFSAVSADSYGVRIGPRLLESASAIASHQLKSMVSWAQRLELVSTEDSQSIENATALLSDDLAELGNAFTLRKNDRVSTPADPPIAGEADKAPADPIILIELNSTMDRLYPDATDQISKKNPQESQLNKELK